MMKKWLAIYHHQIRYEVEISEEKPILLSGSDQADVYIKNLSTLIQLTLKEERIVASTSEGSIHLQNGSIMNDLIFYLMTDTWRIFDLDGRLTCLISQDTGSDLRPLDEAFEVFLKSGKDHISVSFHTDGCYHNNLYRNDSAISLLPGDELSYRGYVFKCMKHELWIRGAIENNGELPEKKKSDFDFYEGYPDYHRSPRVIYHNSEDAVSINAPGKEPNKPEEGLLRMILPPLIMVSMLILVSIIQPRGIYILVTMAMSIVTVTNSVISYFKSRKKYKQDLRIRKDQYRRYLSDKAAVLKKRDEQQKKGERYHYPSIAVLNEMADRYSHRIYEKTPLHFDFLYYRLGLGKVATSYQLKYSQTERSGQTDPLEAEGYALYRRHLAIPEMPVKANLTHGPVGYIGPRKLVLEQLQLMVQQLAFFHSYHDLRFVTIMPEEEKQEWEWMRWLPHASLGEINVRGFVYNQRTRDQVLNSLNQILKFRNNELENRSGKEGLRFSPHYVVMITDEKLILDHIIMEFFSENPLELGCSLVFVQDVLSSLSENVSTIVEIRDRNMGQLLLEEGERRETPFALDHFPEGYDRENLARRLAALNHLENLKSSIPDSVTFLEMYHADTCEELQMLKRWSEHAPYKSLAVPIGLRGQDDIVYLNLHEKAHGPHGLIAGTTGSGKSEFIQSYILSLAVNFHPYDVAFLLIDYKGGGMANLFQNLPHLLGTITNLDGAQSMRALASINAELKRRQRLFAEHDVNHINQYQKKYKLGEVSVPMPHLFLISDEFAELKTNQPEFMAELISTARIGRSLGIHLILATQKPSGVVNEQIWSNSRFKIALKVADRQDSNEMLHTPDAAEITQTGRAYLQVGNNEVYELFQSAWSGADYQPDKENQGIEDHTIYKINELGQYEILNEDLSGLEDADEIHQVPSELDAIVREITKTVNIMKLSPLPQPWLPPLAKRILLDELYEQSPEWTKEKQELSFVFGQVDIPSQQAQITASHSFSKDGNLALFGGPGTGKTTFLLTAALDLARKNTPEQLEFYLLDFGNNGLLPLLSLPHTADIVHADDQEKLPKLIMRFSDIIRERKRLFSEYTVATLDAYERASGNRLPHIVLLVDSYDGLKGSSNELPMDSMIATLARDGSSLGIFIIITAGRLNAIRSGLASSIKTKLSLKLTDDSESRAIVGRTQYIIDDLPGRGLMKLEEPEIFQTALPAEGEDEFEILENIKCEIQQLDHDWTGNRPRPIPVLPEELTEPNFLNMSRSCVNRREIPVGLTIDTVELLSIPLADFRHLLIMSDKETNLKAAFMHATTMLLAVSKMYQFPMVLFDLKSEYPNMRRNVTEHISDEAAAAQRLAELKEEVLQLRQKGERKEQFLLISDLQSFMKSGVITENDFAMLYEEGMRVGLHLIYASNKSFFVSSMGLSRYLKDQTDTALIAMKLINQTVFIKSFSTREEEMQTDQLYLHYKDVQTRLKITSENV